MNRTSIATLASVVLAGATPALGGTFTFDGGPKGDGQAWSIAANWSPDGVPGAADTAIVGEDDPSTTWTVLVDANTDIGSLTLAGGSNLNITNGAVVTVSGAASLTGDLLEGDDAFVDIYGDGTLVLDGAAAFLSVALAETVSVVVNGSLESIDPGEAWVNFIGSVDTSVTINGSVHLGGNDIGNNAFNAGTITVNPDGLLTITTDGWDVEALTGGVTNHGTIRVDCGAGNTGIFRDVGTCDGALDVVSGTMELVGGSGSAQMSGPVTVAAEATLRCRVGNPNAFVFSGTLAGDGRLLIDAGVGFDNVAATIALVEIGEPGLLTLTSDSTLAGDFTQYNRINGGGSLTVQGNTTIHGYELSEDTTLILDGPSTFLGNYTLKTGAALVFNADAHLAADIGPGGSHGGSVTIGSGATLTMDGAAVLECGTGSESLGTIEKIGAGEASLLEAAGSGGIANNGLIRVLEGSLLDLTTVTNTGDVEVAAGATYAAKGGTSTAESEWTGEGTIDIRFIPINGYVTHHGTINASHGILHSRLCGDGAFDFETADIDGFTLCGSAVLTLGDVTALGCQPENSSTIRVTGTCDMNAQWSLRHDARVEIEGTFNWTAGLLDSNSSGTMLAVLPGGVLNCTVGTSDCYTRVRNEGTIVMNHTGTVRFFESASSTSDGLIELVAGTTVYSTGSLVQGVAGATRLNGGELIVAGDATFAQGLLAGTGTLAETVHAPATTISPGASPGELTIGGNLGLGTDSAYVVELAGTQPGEFDHLVVEGTATLGGTIIVGYLDEFEPEIGDSFTILTANAIVGEFDAAAGLGEYDVSYDANTVTLTVIDPDASCPGDVSDDEETGFNDLLVILSEWGPCPEPPDPCPADANKDGFVDFADLLTVLSEWGPCPENVLYDVMFSSPLHNVDDPPTIGGGPPVRETVTSHSNSTYYSSSPWVADDVSGLTQPLRIRSEGNRPHAWISLALPDLPTTSRYHLEFDVAIQDVTGNATAFRCEFGNVASRVLVTFLPDGVLMLNGPGFGLVRSYEPDVPQRIRMELDDLARTADFYIDDVWQAQIADMPAGRPDSVFFYSRTYGGIADAAIDNVKITAIQ